jgi:hypothetical protein
MDHSHHHHAHDSPEPEPPVEPGYPEHPEGSPRPGSGRAAVVVLLLGLAVPGCQAAAASGRAIG